MHICIYSLLSTFSFANMYAHLYRINYLVLSILCGSLSLEETNSPSLSSHWLLVALHPGVGSYAISLSCLHVNWCHHCIDIIQDIIFLDFMGTCSLPYLGHIIQKQIFWSLVLTVSPIEKLKLSPFTDNIVVYSSQIGRINIVKMTILPQANYRFNLTTPNPHHILYINKKGHVFLTNILEPSQTQKYPAFQWSYRIYTDDDEIWNMLDYLKLDIISQGQLKVQTGAHTLQINTEFKKQSVSLLLESGSCLSRESGVAVFSICFVKESYSICRYKCKFVQM